MPWLFHPASDGSLQNYVERQCTCSDDCLSSSKHHTWPMINSASAGASGWHTTERVQGAVPVTGHVATGSLANCVAP